MINYSFGNYINPSFLWALAVHWMGWHSRRWTSYHCHVFTSLRDGRTKYSSSLPSLKNKETEQIFQLDFCPHALTLPSISTLMVDHSCDENRERSPQNRRLPVKKGGSDRRGGKIEGRILQLYALQLVVSCLSVQISRPWRSWRLFPPCLWR